MSENNGWLPIETAPADVPVRVGKWNFFHAEKEWREDEGVVFRTRLFGLIRQRQFTGEYYHYWQPLPPPPPETHTQEG